MGGLEHGVAHLLTDCRRPAKRAMRTFVVEALQHSDILDAFRAYMEVEVLARTAQRLQGPHAEHRATAAVAILIGLVFSRYIVELPSMVALARTGVHELLSGPIRQAVAPGSPTRGALRPDHR
ncbi:hypothetical protein [Mycolicibacterium sp. CH28]|uniref:TetR/AcrR family transcriptional regulator n=1 Tax=Mycolicibacterium sp. CH28 TaxID=2512237 RepID=UPI001386C76F|nr:hypothetical protein [Mycolicibacterium sp. CH28]